MYQNFITENSPVVASLESGLRSASYLLPGRFKDAEVASEGIFASIRLLGYYHDAILDKEAMRQNPKAPSLYNRYTKAILKRYPFYKKLAIVLVWIQSFEAAAEMLVAKKYGKKAQNRLVWMVELAKYEMLLIVRFIIRLAMLKLNGRRMISRVPRIILY
jgi:peroxin-16